MPQVRCEEARILLFSYHIFRYVIKNLGDKINDLPIASEQLRDRANVKVGQFVCDLYHIRGSLTNNAVVKGGSIS